MWNEIIYPFSSIRGTDVEVCEWVIAKVIPFHIVLVMWFLMLALIAIQDSERDPQVCKLGQNICVNWWRVPDKSTTLQWPHDERDGVSNHQPHNCSLNRLFRHRSKKLSMLCVTGLCEGNSPATAELPAQRTSNAQNVSIWWRHHETKVAQLWNILWYIVVFYYTSTLKIFSPALVQTMAYRTHYSTT